MNESAINDEWFVMNTPSDSKNNDTVITLVGPCAYNLTNDTNLNTFLDENIHHNTQLGLLFKNVYEQLNSLKLRVNNLEDDNDTIKKENAILKTENTLLKNKISEMKQEAPDDRITQMLKNKHVSQNDLLRYDYLRTRNMGIRTNSIKTFLPEA